MSTPYVTTALDNRPAGSPPPVDPAVFMTRISSRSPQWKSHSRMSSARGALTYHRKRGYGRPETRIAEIWEIVNGEWRQVE